ncbi:MAG: DegV family protein [Clostridia bacterium]|nr:DegV family protein [Clostridia bacterium]MBR1686537.1 DegV family protein [Clostridia bacterium]
MRETVIFIDAAADIGEKYTHAHDVRCIPMTCISGGTSFTLSGDEDDATIQGFYEDMRKGKMISTSQITPDEYVRAFRPVLEEGKDIIYLSLSSGLTNTYESALAAREKLEKKCPDAHLYPVDTLSATGGINLLIEKAVENRDKGLSAEENAALLEKLSHRVCHVFVVNDLMHLMRGGRVSATSAVFGTALQIKPILIIDPNGKLTVVEKKRGAKAALKELEERFVKSRDKDEHSVYMCHADSQAFLETLQPLISQAAPDAVITPRLLSPVIGAHTGPGMISVIYFGDRNAI